MVREVKKTDLSISIGHEIQALRKARWWSCQDLAKEAGLHASQVSKIESGTPCTVKTLTKVLSAMGYAIFIGPEIVTPPAEDE